VPKGRPAKPILESEPKPFISNTYAAGARFERARVCTILKVKGLEVHPTCSAGLSPLSATLTRYGTFWRAQQRPGFENKRLTCFDLRISAAVSPLSATLTRFLISVASKRLTEKLSPLSATLTKNRGGPRQHSGLQPPPAPTKKRKRERRDRSFPSFLCLGGKLCVGRSRSQNFARASDAADRLR
jgi:hypothetical protein